MNDSRFNMWRLIVAAAHLDKTIDPEEQRFIDEYLNNLSLSDNQKQQLQNELKNAVDIDQIWPAITEAVDRGQALHFVRLILWSDGIMMPSEKDFMTRLKSKIISKNDIDDATAKVNWTAPKDNSKRSVSQTLRDFIADMVNG